MTSAEITLRVRQTQSLMQQARRVSDRLEQVTDEALLALNQWGHEAPARIR